MIRRWWNYLAYRPALMILFEECLRAQYPYLRVSFVDVLGRSQVGTVIGFRGDTVYLVLSSHLVVQAHVRNLDYTPQWISRHLEDLHALWINCPQHRMVEGLIERIEEHGINREQARRLTNRTFIWRVCTSTDQMVTALLFPNASLMWFFLQGSGDGTTAVAHLPLDYLMGREAV